MQDVLGLILGGGRGSRLYPLTERRSKPAVPLAGKYRLIDIPISNCINSDIDKIAILTQFNSVSLHRHIHSTYRRDMFTRGWVEILAAEQTPKSDGWYQGTADAVRQHLDQIRRSRTRFILILAGDHLYQMDYRKFVQYHIETKADITLAVQPIEAGAASAMGILKRSESGQILSFTEKPTRDELTHLESMVGSDKPFMASMGIYVFSTDLLLDLLETPGNDFGKDLIPRTLSKHRIMGYVFDGYWADIGTIRRFYEVNLEMASLSRPFDFNRPNSVFTHPRFLPPAEVYGAQLNQVLLGDGCRLHDATISNSVIGLRNIVGPGVTIKETVTMGADYYETEADRARNKQLNLPDLGIGQGTTIEAAIIDKNARIGRNVQIRHIADRPDSENENWVARDGLVIVRNRAVVHDGTII